MRYDTTRQGKRNCAIDKARERERGRDVERQGRTCKQLDAKTYQNED